MKKIRVEIQWDETKLCDKPVTVENIQFALEYLFTPMDFKVKALNGQFIPFITMPRQKCKSGKCKSESSAENN